MMIRYASAILTLAGVLALVLGVLVWTATAPNLISLHMLLGFLSVGALWVITLSLAFGGRASWILAACALVVGVATIVVGLYQSSLMVGPSHWIIRLVHLVLGVLTIGLGHIGAARDRKAQKESCPCP